MRRKSRQLTEELGKSAHERHARIVNRELQRRVMFIQNVEDLVSMFDNQEYRAILGESEGTWSGYLGQVETFYSRAQVERWRKIYTKFTKEYSIDPVTYVDVPESRLEDIARISKSREEALEWFSKGRTIATAQDWKDELAPLDGRLSSDECEHTPKVYLECTKCGKKQKQEVSIEHLHESQDTSVQQ